MPRNERPLDPGDTPLLRFAAELRRLRESVGSPVYRELSVKAHYSVAVLSEAAGGRKLPSLAVTLAYADACGGAAELARGAGRRPLYAAVCRARALAGPGPHASGADDHGDASTV